MTPKNPPLLRRYDGLSWTQVGFGYAWKGTPNTIFWVMQKVSKMMTRRVLKIMMEVVISDWLRFKESPPPKLKVLDISVVSIYFFQVFLWCTTTIIRPSIKGLFCDRRYADPIGQICVK